MNLTDLQIELRAIENRLSALQAEIEKMKPQPQKGKKEEFEKITKLARQYPLKNPYLAKKGTEIKRAYIACLSYIALLDESAIYEKQLYLSRLAKGLGTSFSPEDIFRLGMELDRDYFDKACSDLKPLKYSFITDALIIANITEGATEKVISVIADIAKIMECGEEDTRVMACVAKAVLTDNLEILKQLPVPKESHWMGEFKQYIPASWLASQRILCGIYDCYESVAAIKKRALSGSIIKKGDILALYDKNKVEAVYERNDVHVVSEKKEFSSFSSYVQGSRVGTTCAPSDGIVFFLENIGDDNYHRTVYVYIICYFDEYTELCKWHKESYGGGRFYGSI